LRYDGIGVSYIIARPAKLLSLLLPTYVPHQNLDLSSPSFSASSKPSALTSPLMASRNPPSLNVTPPPLTQEELDALSHIAVAGSDSEYVPD
jgi:hypothetical protein